MNIQNYFDAIEEIKRDLLTANLDSSAAHHPFKTAIAAQTCKYILGAEIISSIYGDGIITDTYGETFDNITICINFGGTVKKFSLAQVVQNSRYIKFVSPELCIALLASFTLHNTLNDSQKLFDDIERQRELDAKKKAEADAKAEAKYQAHKEKAIKEFKTLAKQDRTAQVLAADEFYNALGWLAVHAGKISAAMPDFLLEFFEKQFGTEANPYIIDSKAKTSGGHAMKYSLSMTIGINKKDRDEVPPILTPHLNRARTYISSNEFVWDLIENYGFQFGKTQDINQIRQTIPQQFIECFEAGLLAE